MVSRVGGIVARRSRPSFSRKVEKATSFGPVVVVVGDLCFVGGRSADRGSARWSEDQMKAGMFAWLICSAICVLSLAYGHVALSAYFLALSVVLPGFVAKQLQRRHL